MKQEEKDLLLKDICAKLPYATKICCTANPKINGHLIGVVGETVVMFGGERADFPISDIQPYLRPLHSMTEEEKEYIKNKWCFEDWDSMYDFLNYHQIDAGDADGFTDWLNANHFDYRGLIEKKLALDCTGLHVYD